MRCSTPGMRNVAQCIGVRRLDRVEQQAEREQDQRPADDVAARRVACRAGARERERHGRAHREQQKGKHEVGDRPAVPERVVERRVDGGPGAWRADENHRGDREAAEDVERIEALRSRGHLLVAAGAAPARQDHPERPRPREHFVGAREAVEKPVHHVHLRREAPQRLPLGARLRRREREPHPAGRAAAQARRRIEPRSVLFERPGVEVDDVVDHVGREFGVHAATSFSESARKCPGGAVIRVLILSSRDGNHRRLEVADDERELLRQILAAILRGRYSAFPTFGGRLSRACGERYARAAIRPVGARQPAETAVGKAEEGLERVGETEPDERRVRFAPRAACRIRGSPSRSALRRDPLP